MGTAGSVCAQPPAAQGLLDQFLAGVRFFGNPDFWQMSDNVNPGSGNPGNGELQKLKQQIYTKKNIQNPYKNTPRNSCPFLIMLLRNRGSQGWCWGQGGPCCQPEVLTPAASSAQHSPPGHCWTWLLPPCCHLRLGSMPAAPAVPRNEPTDGWWVVDGGCSLPSTPWHSSHA